ncbi:MAG: hypothetical protein ACPGN6_09745 [Gammaproteobacteria bacterium]
MIKVGEDLKTRRRWVNREIKNLDPETDYALIMSMIAQYQMDEFTLNFLVTILTCYVVKPAYKGRNPYHYQQSDASPQSENARCARFLLDLVCDWPRLP